MPRSGASREGVAAGWLGCAGMLSLRVFHLWKETPCQCPQVGRPPVLRLPQRRPYCTMRVMLMLWLKTEEPVPDVPVIVKV